MAFPTTGLLSDFTGADADPIPGWTTPLLTGANRRLRRVSNMLARVGTGTIGDGLGCDGILNVQQAAGAHELYVTLVVAPAGDTGFVGLSKYTSQTPAEADGYQVVFYGDGAIELYRIDNGSFVGPLGLSGNLGVALGAGDMIGVEFLDDTAGTINVYHRPFGQGWPQQPNHSFTDATYKGLAGFLGFEINQATTRLDDMGGGVIGAVSPQDLTGVGAVAAVAAAGTVAVQIAAPPETQFPPGLLRP